MKKGKWVVFDLDGTLNRADLMTVEANRQAQREFNQPISEPEVIISAVGEKSDDYLNYIRTQPEQGAAGQVYCKCERASRVL